jgi:hypothetical protein
MQQIDNTTKKHLLIKLQNNEDPTGAQQLPWWQRQPAIFIFSALQLECYYR